MTSSDVWTVMGRDRRASDDAHATRRPRTARELRPNRARPSFVPVDTARAPGARGTSRERDSVARHENVAATARPPFAWRVRRKGGWALEPLVGAERRRSARPGRRGREDQPYAVPRDGRDVGTECGRDACFRVRTSRSRADSGARFCARGDRHKSPSARSSCRRGASCAREARGSSDGRSSTRPAASGSPCSASPPRRRVIARGAPRR